MGLEDRDWYREAYKEKEKKYGGDFSLHSKPKTNRGNGKTQRKMPMSSNTGSQSKQNGIPKTVLILLIFYGSVGVLWLMSKTIMAWPLSFVMFIYNIWALITVWVKEPKAGIGLKILAIFFFVVSEGVMGLMVWVCLNKFLL